MDLFHSQCTCPEVGGPKSDHMGAICGGRGLDTCIFPRFVGCRGPETFIFLGFLRVREAAGGRHQGQMALKCRLAGRWGRAYGRGEIKILLRTAELPRRSATAPEQLGCQVNCWMGGLSGGPFPAQNYSHPPKQLAISGHPNQQFGGSRGLPWRSRFLPKTTPKPIENLQFRAPQISNFGGVSGGPGGLGVVLGAPGESRGVPEGSRGAPGGVPGGSWGPPGRLPGVSGSPWGGPGRSREGLGAFLRGSRGVLGGSRGGPAGSWEGLGRGPGGSGAVPGAPGPPGS